MSIDTPDAGAADPTYQQLDEIHKLVEELKAENASLQNKLVSLRDNIKSHHNKILGKEKS